jgi:hypothetical protein
MNRSYPFLRKFILIIFILISLVGQAQTRLSDIDISRIHQKSIRKFIKDQMERGIETFADFRPSVNGNIDSSRFDFYRHLFSLQQTPAKAWNTYKTAHPDKIWNGKVVSFGFIYSPKNDEIIFQKDAWPGLEPGQLFFLEFRVFCGLYRFPVCFMLTKIDEPTRTILLSYVASGSSTGYQSISLIDNGKGDTEIIHSTIHQPRNILRDKIFYPFYHKKAIGKVHRNIRRIMESN